MRARVVRTVYAVAAPAAREHPRASLYGPHRSKNDLWISGRHGQRRSAGRIVDVEHLLPVFAAVDRFVDAAIGRRFERVADGGDIDDIRIVHIDGNLRDGRGRIQANVRPRRAAVVRAPHAVAVRDVVAHVRLAGSEINNLCVRRCHRDRTDRRNALLIEDGRPLHAAVRRTPQSAQTARKERCGVARNAGHGIDAPGRGPDITKFELCEGVAGVGKSQHWDDRSGDS